MCYHKVPKYFSSYYLHQGADINENFSVDNGTRGFACCVWPTPDRLCPLEERGYVEGLEELKQMEEWVEEEGSKKNKRNVLYPKSLEDMLIRGQEQKEHSLFLSLLNFSSCTGT